MLMSKIFFCWYFSLLQLSKSLHSKYLTDPVIEVTVFRNSHTQKIEGKVFCAFADCKSPISVILRCNKYWGISSVNRHIEAVHKRKQVKRLSNTTCMPVAKGKRKPLKPFNSRNESQSQIKAKKSAAIVKSETSSCVSVIHQLNATLWFIIDLWSQNLI